MSCFNGRNGALSVGGTNIAQLTSWDLTQSADAVECTFMGQQWKSHEAGIASWEGSCEALFAGDAVAGDANELTRVDTNFANSLIPGSPVALVFYAEAGEATNTWTGNAVVTSIENSATMDDMMTVSLSFTGTGELANTFHP